MGEKIGSMYYEITGDSGKLEATLRRSKEQVRAAGTEFGRQSDNVSKFFTGADYRGLGRGMDEFVGTLKAATPEAASFARRAGEISTAFEHGEISRKTAISQMSALRSEMKASELAGMSFGQKLKANWQSIALGATAVVGGAVAVGAALKQVYTIGKEGAQLEYAAGKFDRLAEGAGTTAKVLLRDLRTAVKGTRSDMELMASAGDFMGLGLAKSHDEVVRLTRVAGALNMDMNQLVLTLTNQTTMRFDALGVSVDGFDEKVKKLKESGLSANEAFKEAFLQQAEEQIGRVGDAADTNVGKIEQMEAATKNLSDAFKLWLAPAVADVAGVLANALTWEQKTTDAFEAAETEILKSATSYRSYTTSVVDAAIASEKFTKEGIANSIYYLRKQSGAYGENQISLKKLNEMTLDQLMALSRQEGYYDAIIRSIGGYSEATFDAAVKTTDFADRLVDGRVGDELNTIKTEAKETDTALDNMGTAAKNAKTDILSLNDIDLSLASTIESELNKIDYYLAGGLPLQQVTADIQAALASGAITPEQGKALLEQAFVAEQALQVELNNITAADAAKNVTDTLGGSLADNKQLVLDTQTELNNIPKELHTDLYIDIHYNDPGGPVVNDSDIIRKEIQQNQDLNGNGVIGAMTGADYIVPTGFTESWRLPGNVVASAGEHVTVTPVGQTNTSGDININLYDPTITTPIEYDKFMYQMARDLKARIYGS